MKASNTLVEGVKRFEGLRLTAYRDSGGLPTIGYGTTKGVKMGMVITAQKAEEMLRADLAGAENSVNALKLNLKQGQFDALVDFVYNLGIGNLKSSTLLKKIKAGAPTAEIQAQFNKWVFCKGVKLPGLVKRRAWEAGLWAS